MHNKIQLTPKKILDKEFKIDFKGYNATEVDYFLDTVLEDYEYFNEMLNEAKQKIESLEAENELLNSKISKLEGEKGIYEDNIQALEEQLSPQVDLIQRISLLEKAVFGSKPK